MDGNGNWLTNGRTCSNSKEENKISPAEDDGHLPPFLIGNSLGFVQVQPVVDSPIVGRYN
jgi:hypothetical protein